MVETCYNSLFEGFRKQMEISCDDQVKPWVCLASVIYNFGKGPSHQDTQIMYRSVLYLLEGKKSPTF